MSAAGMGPDPIVTHVAIALSASRVASAALNDVIIPAMPPARRTFPQSLARKIDRRDIISEDFVRDSDVLIQRLEREVSDATVIGWEADDHHTAGGYEIVYRSDDIAGLAAAAHDLAVLRDLVSLALDVVRAHSIAEDLLAA